MQRLLVLIATALIGAGLIVGFALPVNSGDFNCGTAFHESGNLAGSEFGSALSGGSGRSDCDEARSSARVLPVVLLVLGAVALAGAPFVGSPESASPRAVGARDA